VQFGEKRVPIDVFSRNVSAVAMKRYIGMPPRRAPPFVIIRWPSNQVASPERIGAEEIRGTQPGAYVTPVGGSLQHH